jgi:hypothetical protein
MQPDDLSPSGIDNASAHLLHLYDLWRRQPFPPGSDVEELDAMHAELAYADAMIADSAIPFVTKGHYSPVPQQALDELDHVLVHARQLEQSDTGGRGRLAAKYKEYAELLRAVWTEIEDVHALS